MSGVIGGIRLKRFVSFKAVLIKVKPVPVRRCSSVFQHVMKLPKAATGVIENTIKDNPHAALVGTVEQLTQRVIAAQQRIDVVVIKGVIPVVRGRGKDRAGIDCRDTQILQIIELLRDAVQVSPLKSMGRRGGVPGFKVLYRCDPAAACEPIGGALLEDSVLHPLRCVDRHRNRLSSAASNEESWCTMVRGGLLLPVTP